MKKKCDERSLDDRIREKARQLWEKGGCQQGRDLEHWLEAERLIKRKVKK
ncbi:MAG: DUF2934 domain-containing protein [Candidatus Omnitrophota bacterium]